jgi:type IV pilus assembly protein PilW
MNKGFTLFELLLALTLGILLTGLITEIYLMGERSMKQQNEFVTIENNARVAIDILTGEIKKTGYIGCARLTNDFPVFPHVQGGIAPENKLTGSSNTLTLRHMGMATHIDLPLTSGEDTVVAGDNIPVTAGDSLVIADCKHAEIIKAKYISAQLHSQRIKLWDTLRFDYDQSAEIGRLEINKFYVAKATAEAVNALFMQDTNGRSTEMVSGISTIQFLYSVRSNGWSSDVRASEINNWSAVQGVALEIETQGVSTGKKVWRAFVRVGEGM